ncbi:MAG: TonB-dependent receptor [Gammaproteobacteria bacterium]|nr:TonB-dependent receptor [Gammaproteobacteria bacterium]
MNAFTAGCGRLLLLSASLTVAVPAFAQSGEGFVLEDVVVTARKREESLQQTPVAVSAFTEDQLRFRQVERTDQLSEITPNLTFDEASPSSGSSSAAQIFIRGIGQTDFTPVTDPGVGLYVDGIYMARSPGNVLDFVDIERVEVLRGPQGTLFGRNTIGGAILVHTKRPDPEALTGSIKGRVGDDSLYNITGKVNVPLSDTAAANFAIDWIERDGYVTRAVDGLTTGDRDRYSLRGSLLWDITESFSSYFTADYTKIDENGPPTVSGGVNDGSAPGGGAFGTFGNGLLASCSAININNGGFGPPAYGPAGGAPVTPGVLQPTQGPPSLPPPGTGSGGAAGCYGPDTRAGNFISEGTYPTFSELDVWGAALELGWEVNNWLEIKSITGYREMEMFSSRDGDHTPANVFNTQDIFDHEQITQELQFINNFFEGQFQSLVGIYYFQEEGKNLNPVTLPVGAIRSGGFYDNDSWALFAQGTFNATDKLAFTLGIRYTEDTKNYLPDQIALGDPSQGSVPGFHPNTWTAFQGFYLSPAPPGNAFALAPGDRILLNQESKVSFDDTNVLANVAYNFTDEVMAYFTFSTGYKSGGFDQRFAGPTPDGLPSTYQPEEVDSYEIGLKSDLLDNTMRLNLAAFFTDYTDQHIIIRETFNPITFNGGESEIKGFELELTWIPTDALYITTAIGYLDAKYTKVSEEAATFGGISTDSSFVNTPEWSSAVGVAYSFELGGWGTLTPRIDWSFTDEQFNDAVNTPQLRQDDYHLLHAALIFQSNDEHWEVILAGRNLTDEDYLITGNSAFTTAASYVSQVFGRPREWQASLKYSF